jgi:hypothetical protein
MYVVLLVEDDDRLREVTAAALGKDGFEVGASAGDASSDGWRECVSRDPR